MRVVLCPETKEMSLMTGKGGYGSGGHGMSLKYRE